MGREVTPQFGGDETEIRIYGYKGITIWGLYKKRECINVTLQNHNYNGIDIRKLLFLFYTFIPLYLYTSIPLYPYSNY